MILHAVRPIGMRRAQLVGVERRVQVHLGDARPEIEECLLDRATRSDAGVHEMVGVHDAFVSRELPVRETDQTLGARPGHAQREPAVDCHLEVHVEELGAQLQRPHVRVEVRDVEAPIDRPFDLGPALLPDLVEVGVVPDVLDRAREPAVAVEEARRVRDRTPAVRLPFGVQGEMYADVLAPVHRGGVPRPRTRHHERRARGQPVAQRFVDRDVCRARRPEIVAVDDHQLGVGRVSQSLRKCRRGQGISRSSSRSWRSAACRPVRRFRDR